MHKHLPSILFLAIIVLLCSCDKDPEPENYLVTQINGARWNTQANVLADLTTDTLLITAFDINKSLRMRIKYRGEGKYKASDLRVSYETLVGGDVLTGSYNVDPSDFKAELIITEHNKEDNTIKGTFQFDVKGHKANSSVEETLKFTGGRFNGKIGVHEYPIYF